MTIVSPSILSCDFLNIESEISELNRIDDIWIHLDIMDGHFVPNLTFGHPIIKKLSSISNHKLDAHLMVTNPEFYIETFKGFGIHNLTFHYEASEDPISLTEMAKRFYPSVGISIKPGTPFSSLPLELLKKIDLLLVMSVEPGFGGQDFIESTYDKLNEIKAVRIKHKLHFQVQVDGGVSNKNAQKLCQHGVDNLVAGSFIFKASPHEYIKKVNSLRQFS